LVAATLKSAYDRCWNDAEDEQSLIVGTLAGSGAGGDRPAGQENETDFLVAQPVRTNIYNNSDPGMEARNLIFESRFARNSRGAPEAVCPPLKAQSGETRKGDSAPLVFDWQSGGDVRLNCGEIPSALQANQVPAVFSRSVRRLTPREYERLQGFKDDYTLIEWRGKPAADGPRYRALGNSMAVPVMRWIGERISMAAAMVTNGD
jgi:DNA (cytosine-5)-methyltransferase 1